MPRILIFQPALPTYRVDFFKRLSNIYGENFHLYYSYGSIEGAMEFSRERYEWASCLGKIYSFRKTVEWQSGALDININRGDLVVICGAPRCLTNLLLLIKAKIRGAKTIWWGHFWSATSNKYRFYIRRLLFRFNDALLFYTDKEIASYRASFKNNGAFVAALNNGIDVEPIKLIRADYIPVCRGGNLLYIGRLTDKSNFILILKALISPEANGVVLHVIGAGKDIEYYKNFVVDNGLDSRVRWYGELLNETEIAQVANKCALFVYPGAVGLSLIHAMAYGLPSIVHNSQRRHMPEIAAFSDHETGYLFEYSSEESLISVISKALADVDNLKKMSDKARHVADDVYNTQRMAERFCELVKLVDS